MKAIVREKYGSPDVLKLDDIGDMQQRQDGDGSFAWSRPCD